MACYDIFKLDLDEYIMLLIIQTKYLHYSNVWYEIKAMKYFTVVHNDMNKHVNDQIDRPHNLSNPVNSIWNLKPRCKVGDKSITLFRKYSNIRYSHAILLIHNKHIIWLCCRNSGHPSICNQFQFWTILAQGPLAIALFSFAIYDRLSLCTQRKIRKQLFNIFRPNNVYLRQWNQPSHDYNSVIFESIYNNFHIRKLIW